MRFGGREIVYDHAIPFRYLQGELMRLDPVTSPAVREVLIRYSVRALITQRENQLLASRGLGRAMPDDWDMESPLARYAAVGIELVANPSYQDQGLEV